MRFPEPIPDTIGICRLCWPEFSVGNAKPGDKCPNDAHFAHYDPETDEFLNPPLIIYTRSAPLGEKDQQNRKQQSRDHRQEDRRQTPQQPEPNHSPE